MTDLKFELMLESIFYWTNYQLKAHPRLNKVPIWCTRFTLYEDLNNDPASHVGEASREEARMIFNFFENLGIFNKTGEAEENAYVIRRKYFEYFIKEKNVHIATRLVRNIDSSIY